ncbi:MAG: Fe-S cluster assembly protein SufE [Gammaproteobacteria bacterium]|nr:MAG: Fe-S cluster assembly protein SufE [Gammaproteobacteria bacterium]
MELGKDITAEDLPEQLDFFSGWEEKYGYIIDLGTSLTTLPESAYIDDNLVKGCQSQVWITYKKSADNRYVFRVDSDALIVKGLLAIILIAYNYKTAEEILAFNIEDYFAKLDLLKHISNVRGNGLRAMVARIQAIAQTDKHS